MDTRARILVATDFSRSSEAAIDHAVALARKLEAELLIAHVVPFTVAGDLAPPSVSEDALVTARQTLERTVAGVMATGVAARGYVRLGETVLGLLQWIEELAPTLVVVGETGAVRLKLP